MKKWCMECGGSIHFLIICKYLIMPVISKGGLDYITNVIWCWSLFRKANYVSPIYLICIISLNTDLFYWRFVLKKSCLCGLWWNESWYISCDLSTWYGLRALCYCCWLFSHNIEDPYIGSIYYRVFVVTCNIIYWLWDIGYVVINIRWC